MYVFVINYLFPVYRNKHESNPTVFGLSIVV